MSKVIIPPSKQNKLAPLLPGIAFAFAIALLSVWLNEVSSLHLGGATWAIVLGLLLGNLISLPQSFHSGVKFSEKKILEWAIILLGASLNFSILQQLKPLLLIGLVLIVLSTILLAYFIAKRSRRFGKLALLMGFGTAVCGSSAIAALAPSLGAKQDAIGLSVGMVNLLGTLAIFILPNLFWLFGLGNEMGSFLLGGSLQAVGHVAAAACIYHEPSVDFALLVKMLRVAMLAPLVLLVSFVVSRTSSSGKTHRRSMPSVPAYLLGFIAVAIIANTLLIGQTWLLSIIKEIADVLLITALAGIGLQIQLSALRKLGGLALGLGLLLFLWQFAALFLLIKL